MGEGRERFAWRDVPRDQEAAWRDAFAGETPAPVCPLCGRPTLRRYFRRYDADRGGG